MGISDWVPTVSASDTERAAPGVEGIEAENDSVVTRACCPDPDMSCVELVSSHGLQPGLSGKGVLPFAKARTCQGLRALGGVSLLIPDMICMMK